MAQSNISYAKTRVIRIVTYEIFFSFCNMINSDMGGVIEPWQLYI